jgi:hypothetical protein
MDQNELALIFNDSYERVMNAPGKTGGFFSAFYSHLIATSPEAAGKFRDTDMEKQVKMLRVSVAILLASYQTDVQDDYLQNLAERHSKRGVSVVSQDVRFYSHVICPVSHFSPWILVGLPTGVFGFWFVG